MLLNWRSVGFATRRHERMLLAWFLLLRWVGPFEIHKVRAMPHRVTTSRMLGAWCFKIGQFGSISSKL